ncbi:MAG: hypothetical protein ACJAZO_001058 [Myxococcota bacterium]|jgi:hypothetical protein
MIERIQIAVDTGWRELATSRERYALLVRLSGACAKQGVGLLGFGLADRQVRFAVEGPATAIAHAMRGVRVGTVASLRGQEVVLCLGQTKRSRSSSVEDALVWAHQVSRVDGALGPLASPWTSHRDVMGFRTASFFDAEAVRSRIDVHRVHLRSGGRALPASILEPQEGAPVGFLMRLSASVLGLLPSDRRSFALFTQLARACGWSIRDVADALMLSARRVRQLANGPRAPVDVALISLHDPRLCVIP